LLSKKVKISFISLLLLFLLFETVSYIALINTGSFLPVPLKSIFSITSAGRVVDSSGQAVKVYQFGDSTFDSVFGWDNFTGFSDRKSPDELISINYSEQIDSSGAYTGKKYISLDPKPLALAFGDSFTYCADVSSEYSWQKQLSKHYNEKVYNMGVLGFGLDQAYLKSIEMSKLCRPGFMVLCLSDPLILRTLGRIKNFLEAGCPVPPIYKPRFKADTKELRLLPVPFSNLSDYNAFAASDKLYEVCKDDGWYNYYKNTFDYDLIGGWYFPYTYNFYTFSKGFYSLKKKGYPMNINTILERYEIPEVVEAAQVSSQIIQAFKENCQSRGIVPVINIVTRISDHFYGKISQFCRDKGIGLYNMVDIIETDIHNAGINESILRFKGSAHYSVFGNNLLAQRFYALMQELKTRGRSNSQLTDPENKLRSMTPDFSFAYFNLYMSFIVKAVPDLNISSDGSEMFSKILDNPFSSQSVYWFANSIKSRMPYMTELQKELIPAIEQIKRFSESLGLIEKSGLPFKDKKYAFAEHSLRRALKLVPAWKRLEDLIDLVIKKDEKTLQGNFDFLDFVCLDFKKDIENFKKAYNLYLRAMENILSKNYVQAEKLFSESLLLCPAFIDAGFSLSLAQLLNSEAQNFGGYQGIKRARDLIYTAKNGDNASEVYYIFLLLLDDLLTNDFSFSSMDKKINDFALKLYFSGSKKIFLPLFMDLEQYKKPYELIEKYMLCQANYILNKQPTKQINNK
jgi:hypothetical protein